MNPDGVIYMGSFSKVLTPGIRLGYVVRPAAAGAPPRAGQAGRRPAHRAADPDGGARSRQGRLPGPAHPDHPHPVRATSARRCWTRWTSSFPEGVTWTRPEGGMFIWVTLPKHIDAMKLLDQAIAAKRRLRAGRAVLRQRAGHQHPAPVLRDRAAGAHPRRHRHPRQADQGSDVSSTVATAAVRPAHLAARCRQASTIVAAASNCGCAKVTYCSNVKANLSAPYVALQVYDFAAVSSCSPPSTV